MSSSIVEERRWIVRNIRDSINDNKICMNCNDDQVPQYACTTFGTFICLRCALFHREFRHKVKNVVLSLFSDKELDDLKVTGNTIANSIWLEKWNENEFRPSKESSDDELRKFIKQVWVDGKWKKEEDHPKLSNNDNFSSTENTFRIDFSQKLDDIENKEKDDIDIKTSKYNFLDIFNQNSLSTTSSESNIMNAKINTTLGIHKEFDLSFNEKEDHKISFDNVNESSFIEPKSFLNFGENSDNSPMFNFNPSKSEFNPFSFDIPVQSQPKINQINFDNPSRIAEHKQKSFSDPNFIEHKHNSHYANVPTQISESIPETKLTNYTPQPYKPPSISSQPSHIPPSNKSHQYQSYLTPTNNSYIPQTYDDTSNNMNNTQLYKFDDQSSQSYDEDLLLAMKLQKEEEEVVKNRDVHKFQILKNDELLARSLSHQN